MFNIHRSTGIDNFDIDRHVKSSGPPIPAKDLILNLLFPDATVSANKQRALKGLLLFAFLLFPLQIRAAPLEEARPVKGNWTFEQDTLWSQDNTTNVSELQLDRAIGPEHPGAVSFSLYERNLEDQKRRAAVKLLDEDGRGYQIKMNLNWGRIGFERVQTDVRAPTQNPCRILKNRKYGGPTRVRVKFGSSHAKLFLGFYDGSARYLHARMPAGVGSIRRIRLVTNHRDIGFSGLSVESTHGALADPFEAASVQSFPPTVNEFIGSHYDIRPYLSVYRGRGGTVQRSRLVRRRGGRLVEVAMHDEKWQQLLPETSGPGIVRMKDLEWPKASPPGLTEQLQSLEAELRKVYDGIQNPSNLPVLWQFGNEINWTAGWKNHPVITRFYAEYQLAPGVEVLRRVSEDLYGEPDAIPVMLASFARSPAADTMGLIDSIMSYELRGTAAPSLDGREVGEVVDYMSVHYMFNGRYWRWYMNHVYDRYVRSGTVTGFWSTEELGLGNTDQAGPAVAETTFRYLDWWSRHDWKTGRGGLIFWGDWWGDTGFSTAYIVEEMLYDFFGRKPLVNRTEDARVSGDDAAHSFVFAERNTERTHFAALVRPDREAWSISSPTAGSNTITIDSLVMPLSGNPPPSSDAFRGFVHKLTPSDIQSGEIQTVQTSDDRLVIPLDRRLHVSSREALLVFVTTGNASFGQALQKQQLTKEQNRRIDGGEVISFHRGNFLRAPDGGIDRGMAGDTHGIGAQPKNDHVAAYDVTLIRDYRTGTEVKITVDPKGGSGTLYWDGVSLLDLSEQNPRTFHVPSNLDLSAGRHHLELRTEGNRTKLDALRIRRPGDFRPTNSVRNRDFSSSLDGWNRISGQVATTSDEKLRVGPEGNTRGQVRQTVTNLTKNTDYRVEVTHLGWSGDTPRWVSAGLFVYDAETGHRIGRAGRQGQKSKQKDESEQTLSVSFNSKNRTRIVIAIKSSEAGPSSTFDRVRLLKRESVLKK